MKLIISGLFVFVMMYFTSCYYDSQEYLYPQISSGCDTANVTFTLSVKPILANSCLSCHSNSTAASYGGNIKLENYADVKTRADDGKLIGSITHSTGFSAMPKNSSQLSDCNIAIIQKWVTGGALNN